MNIMEVKPVREDNKQTDSIESSIEDSNGSDLLIPFGHYHYKRTYNGDIDLEFNVPILIESTDELNSTLDQIRKDLMDGEITITIHKKTEYWDDIPSPPAEDLAQAIAIMNEYELPEPEVPKVPETDQPSWD